MARGIGDSGQVGVLDAGHIKRLLKIALHRGTARGGGR